MAGNRSAAVDTIIANTFRYMLVFGFSTHVYDTSKHQLVYSRQAHSYSLSFHLTLVGLAPVSYMISKSEGKRSPGKSNLYDNLGNLLPVLQLLAICVSLCLQWTTRKNAATLFNEILQIWHKDVANLQSSREVGQQAASLFISKALTSALIIAHTAYTTYSAEDFFKALRHVYILLIFNILIVVLFIFCSGLVFSQYIFRILNYNLERVVEDVADLRSAQRPLYALRHELVLLEKKLTDIGRIHAQLQEWVVRFKKLYQVELMLIITMFFLLQVGVLFILCVVIRVGMVRLLLLHFLRVFSAALCNILDLMLLCYICGELLHASDEAGQIMKQVPIPDFGLCSIQLERRIEILCIQFKLRKLRLRICGLVDLDWSQSFVMLETALLYIILLIQADYDEIWK